MYGPQYYILFCLAIILFLSGLALLGTIVEWQEKRKARRRELQLRNLNRREEWRRQHTAYIAHMEEVLERVEGGKGA